MAFSLDPTRNHLALNEADITHLFRSTHSAVPPDPLFLGHPCQAYVCATNEHHLHHVFIAILDTTSMLPLIFTSSYAAKDSSTLKRLIKEAHTFADSMGFALDPVNLDYSAAMRQVIIRGLRVMRPPGRNLIPSVVQTVNSTSPAESKPDISGQSVQNPALVLPSQETLLSERQYPDMELPIESLLDQAERLRKEISEPEATSNELQPEITQLPEKDAADSNKSDQPPGCQRDPHIDTMYEKTASINAAHDTKIMKLETALALETALRLEAESAVATLRESCDRVMKEHYSQREELEVRLSEALAATAELQESLARDEVLRCQLGLIAEDTAARLHNELVVLRREQEDLRADLCRQANELLSVSKDRDLLREELEQAYAAKEVALEEVRKSAATGLEQQLEARRLLELRLEELTATCEETRAERELERRRSASEIKSITARFNRISGEKKVWDSIAANFRKKARTVVEKLRKEKEELEKEVQLLKKLAPVPVVQSHATFPSGEQYSPFAALGMSTQTAHAGIAASIAGSAADFRHDPTIDAIHYHSDDDIIELYGSGNVIQAAPFGRRSQKCNAYICVVEREGGPHIYLAWQLIQDGAALFCLPEKQPGGDGSYARMVQDALYYFESVGFMMDRFELSRGSERQLQALEKTGICRRDSEPKQPDKTDDVTDVWRLNAAA